MNFTDIFIRRPVLSSVISLFILLLGLQALYKLPVRQYPEMHNTVITVTTTYPGATANLMKGFITTPIEQAIASADGLDYMTSQSMQSTSMVSAHIKLDYDPNKALTEIMSKVAQTKNVLPRKANSPVITKSTGQTHALMYLSFASPKMTGEQITEYLTRVVQPQIQTISGVAQAEILGGKTFSMRVWLDPQKMAAFGITPSEAAAALRANNYQAAAGQTKGYYVVFNINVHTGLKTTGEFGNLVVKSDSGTLIRLKDIAHVKLGPQNPDSSVMFNGEKAVFIGVRATPTANPLEVITAVRGVLPHIKKQLPPTLEGRVVYDATKYIRASIREVTKTIGEATLIVIIIMFLFLGSFRSVAIPLVTIPLSLIGAGFLLLALGYSLNLLTLLAMVLAIGLVVDDAIVVVENIHRHIEEGSTPFRAAIKGAREIATAVIAMTITLAAVYAPIGFVGGLTGALFREFVFTLAGSVIISGVIALTLSPMMCSKILVGRESRGRFVRFLDKSLDRLRRRYEQMLGGNYVNRFSLQGRSYEVIPQLQRKFRIEPGLIKQIHVRTASGALVPISEVVTPNMRVRPNQLSEFQQLNSATIQAVMLPGVTLGQGLDFLQREADRIFPRGFTYNYKGGSRQFLQEGNRLTYAFLFAVIVIYLVLAAQFESFRDPLIILISVPMAICGALILLNLGLATVNIYTQVGLVTLIGLISKHGILIVAFANQLQETEGLGKREAVEKAAGIRLRPVLMTTAAMVVAMVPLLIASGAGAKSRFDVGLVIASGMSIGTLFTLFMVPTMYTYLANDRSVEGRVAGQAGGEKSATTSDL